MTRATSLHLRRRGLAPLVAILCVSLAACSSSSGGKSGSGSTKPPSLKIAIAGGFVDFSHLFIAQAEGLFAKHGVDVTLQQDTGSNTLNYAVSGQVDMAIYTAPIALQAAAKGKDMSVVYAVERDPGAALLTGKSITSVEQLQQKSSCRLAVPTTGSQGYAYGVIYQKALGLKCSLIQVSLPALELGGLKSGSYDAAVTTYAVATQGVSQGDNMLINPLSDADRAKYPVPPYPTAVLFGVTSQLKEKKDAVVRALQAVNDAIELENSMTDEQWAEALQKVGTDFKTQTTASLAAQVKSIRPFIGKGIIGTMTDKPGYISEQLWTTALQQYENWGLQGFDPSSPTMSYASRVDMSYLNDAK